MAKDTPIKKICGFSGGVLALALLAAFLITGGCKVNGSEGFAIYLTRYDVPPANMESLSHVNLADQPIISMNDVINYYSQTYTLKLKDAAFSRLSNLEVPTTGKSFVVCVDEHPVYWGAFWSGFSSQSFNGVTICKPFIFLEAGLVSIELGYPATYYYNGEDPRNNPEILNSFEQAGKLIKELNLSTIHSLPPSGKGYELYSWLQEGEWHFTLIRGTNRGKTLDEIVNSENSLSEAGLVKISVIGVEDIKEVLSKVTVETSVTWMKEIRASSAETKIQIQLPPIEIRDSIRDFALQSRLDFHILEP
jgi:hypothetical protein